MAFSSFRLMMAASKSAAPVIPSIYMMPIVPSASSSNGGGDQYNGQVVASCKATSTTAYTIGASSNPMRVFLWGPATSGGYVALKASNTISGSFGTGTNTIDMDSVPGGSNAVMVTAQGTTTYGWSLTQGGTTVTPSSQYTVFVGTGTTQRTKVCATDSSNALVFSMQQNSATSQFSLVNATTMSTVYQTAASNLTGAISTFNDLRALSSTLAVFTYSDNSTHNIYIKAIDVVSGTGITVRSDVSTSITSTGGARIIPLTTTTFILAYTKNSTANTLFARVVTYTGSGAFSLGTEYSTTANGINSAIALFKGAILTSSQGVVGWVANRITYMQGMSVSGTVVSFATQYTVDNSAESSGITPAVINSETGVLVGLSSSLVFLQGYMNDNANGAGGYSAGINGGISYLINVSSTAINPSWTTSWNNYACASQTYNGAADSTRNPAFSHCGMGRLIWTVGDSSPIIYYMAALLPGYTNIPDLTSVSSTDSSLLSNGYCYSQCPFSTVTAASNTITQVMSAYIDSSNNVKVRVVYDSIISSGTDGGQIALGSIVTVDTSAGSMVTVVSYDVDKQIVFYTKSTGLYAQLLTTSAQVVTKVGSPVLINSVTVNSNNWIRAVVIDTLTIGLSYKIAGSQDSVIAICSLSGGTPVLGTPVKVGVTGHQPYGVDMALLSSTTGVVVYIDSVANTVNGIGFSYSGTTITLSGTTNTLYTLISGVQANPIRCNLVALDSTHMMYSFQNSSRAPYYAIVTSTGVNSVTMATPITSINPAAPPIYTGIAPWVNNYGVVLMQDNNLSFGILSQG